MSKKRKKKTLAEPFSSWMINHSESEVLIDIAKKIKNELEILVEKLGISSTIESIDNLYSLTKTDTSPLWVVNISPLT